MVEFQLEEGISDKEALLLIESSPRSYANDKSKSLLIAGGSPGLVVMGRDSCSEGCGFESQYRILDGHFFTYICCKNCNDVCLKRPQINEKEARVGPFKKSLYRLTFSSQVTAFGFSYWLRSRGPVVENVFVCKVRNFPQFMFKFRFLLPHFR